MVTDEKRIRIITGHYGSGKTEFAVNYAFKLRPYVKKLALCDLDIVNPYFRSRERAADLEAAGIEVISSSLVGDTIDIPAISARASGPMTDKDYDYIIDLGGNDVGVIAIRRFKPFINTQEVDLLMTVNVYRPDTAFTEGVIEQMKALEFMAQMPVTGFINNSNLTRATTAECLLQGDKILREVEQLTGVPIKYTAYIEELVKEDIVGVSGELFPMKYYMREDWM